MIEDALIALTNLMSIERLGFLIAGVLMGLALGAIPGLGGLVGLAILLPFTFQMDPFAAFAIMIGLVSVTATSDTIPAVLFGIPGTVASQATILDGHPMARKGEAGRAFGAAYTASLIGGLFGSLILGISIPVIRPIVLAFGSPEFFMLGIFGISMVAVISGNAPLKGLIAGTCGLALGMVGMDPQLGVLRWEFGQLYLWEGLHIVPVSLGLFALPEIIDLRVRGTQISEVPVNALKGVLAGVKDALRNWFLVMRCSGLGVFVGAIPGLGASVVDWFAYGHAIQTEKGARESFGKGDVRGVIAPESANNAKEGGALIPTIAFGVPGSATMALLLSAMTIQGLAPGPGMLTRHLDVTFTMIWSVALANIFGAGICLMLTNQLAKIARINIQILAPMVIAIVFLGSFQATRSYGDLWVLIAFGAIGWCMKKFHWPRPPLILGFVLSGIIEENLLTSISRYGTDWLMHTIVIILALASLATFLYGLRSQLVHLRQAFRGEPARRVRRFRAGSIFTLFVLLSALAGVLSATEWPVRAKMFPYVVLLPAVFLCVLQLASDIFGRQDGTEAPPGGLTMDLAAETSMPPAVALRRTLALTFWMAGLFAAIWLIGFVLAVPAFILSYLALSAKESWPTTLSCAGVIFVFIVGVFHLILHVPWPDPVFAVPQDALLDLFGSGL